MRQEQPRRRVTPPAAEVNDGVGTREGKGEECFYCYRQSFFLFFNSLQPTFERKILTETSMSYVYCGHLNPILTVNPFCFANRFIDIVYLRLNLSEQHYSTNRSTHLWRQDSSAPGQARKPTTPERMRTWTTQRPTTRPKPSS